MIEMAVRMHDEQRDLCIILVGQQLQYLFSEWHLCGIRDRAGIDQKRFIRSDEQVEEISFETRAQTLAEDKRLRIVYVNLKGVVRSCATICRTFVQTHLQRTLHRL